MPAFALIKVFSSFFFANHNTKTPFYISLVSVILNIVISVYYFNEVGFIIIPMATTISSWFNCILLFIFLKNGDFFSFNQTFLIKFSKIVISSILMGFVFQFLLNVFQDKLAFEQTYKSIYLIFSALMGLTSYIVISYFIKAFKISDIKLEY